MAEAETTDKPKLDVKVEDVGPARKKLVIEVPEDRVKGKIEDSYGSLQTDAVVPGFRRGRAPRRLIEKRFGEAVRSDTKGQIISEAYSQAIEDEKIDVIGEPDVEGLEEIELPESGPLTFTVEVEVTPQVELPDFKKIKVEKPSAEVADADIDEELDRYAERFGQVAPADDGKVKAGDYVTASLQITGEGGDTIDQADEVYILVHGKDHDYKGHVRGILIDDLGKRLTGKGVGHAESIEMTGPQGHENEAIKGKPIKIDLAIRKIERIKPAEPPQLAEQMGFESVDAMRNELKAMLAQRKAAQQRSEMHRQVRQQLVEAVNLELPEGITGRQAERNFQRQRLEMLYRGMSEQDADEKLAELRNESDQEARKQLAEFFIIDAAAKKLAIEVQENEINGRIAAMAMQQGRRPEKLRQEMRRRGELENLYLQLREQKTLDKVLEEATVTDAAPTPAPGSKGKTESSATKTESSAKKKSTKKKTTKKTTKKKSTKKKKSGG